jgi:hypothetical protein
MARREPRLSVIKGQAGSPRRAGKLAVQRSGKQAMLALAEIGDKMPTVLSTLLVSIVVTAVALGLARFRWWLALLALPVFALWNWIHYSELHEPGFGPIVWSEMGTAYVLGQFGSINTPAVIGVWIVTRFRHAQIQRQRRCKGLCPECDYPVESGICPECGKN